MNIDLRKQCEFFGFTENHNDESILIFHSCSSNLFLTSDDLGESECNELHTGNTPRSIMTKGNSVTIGTPYGNFIRGNRDKMMISYSREPSHDYIMTGACGVLFEGEMHFFGGGNFTPNEFRLANYMNEMLDFRRQHFVIETQRSGQVVKMTRKEDLEIGLEDHSCSSFETTSEFFPWFKTNVVILCFGLSHGESCYSYDGKMTYIGDSNYSHYLGGLTRYRGSLFTVGSDGFFFIMAIRRVKFLKAMAIKISAGLSFNQISNLLKAILSRRIPWSL